MNSRSKKIFVALNNVEHRTNDLFTEEDITSMPIYIQQDLQFAEFQNIAALDDLSQNGAVRILTTDNEVLLENTSNDSSFMLIPQPTTEKIFQLENVGGNRSSMSIDFDFEREPKPSIGEPFQSGIKDVYTYSELESK